MVPKRRSVLGTNSRALWESVLSVTSGLHEPINLMQNSILLENRVVREFLQYRESHSDIQFRYATQYSLQKKKKKDGSCVFEN
jgi:hypothetical protein